MSMDFKQRRGKSSALLCIGYLVTSALYISSSNKHQASLLASVKCRVCRLQPASSHPISPLNSVLSACSASRSGVYWARKHSRKDQLAHGSSPNCGRAAGDRIADDLCLPLLMLKGLISSGLSLSCPSIFISRLDRSLRRSVITAIPGPGAGVASC